MADSGRGDGDRIEHEEKEHINMDQMGVARQASLQAPSSNKPPIKHSKSLTEKRKNLGKSIKRSLTKGVTDFFLGDLSADEADVQKAHTMSRREKWRNRSVMLQNNALIGGQVKQGLVSVDTPDSVFETASQAGSTRNAATGNIVDPLHRPQPALRQDSKVSRSSRLSKSFNLPSRQWSRVSTASSGRRSTRPMPRRVSRKESVAKMAYDGIKDWVQGSRKSKKRPIMHSRSFTPATVAEPMFDDLDFAKRRSPATDSVFTDDAYLDDVFFNTPTPTSTILSPFSRYATLETRSAEPLATIAERASHASDGTRGSSDAGNKSSELSPEISKDKLKKDFSYEVDSGQPLLPKDDSESEIAVPVTVDEDFDQYLPPKFDDMRPTKSGWRISVKKPPPIMKADALEPDTPDFLDEPDGIFEGMSRIKDTLIESALDYDNSERREIGKGLMGNILDLTYRKDRMNSEIEAQIEAMDEHRPYFTYWVTFVQVVIYIISVSVYGIAPIGFEETRIFGEVRMPNLAIQIESRVEKDNLWIGPRQADLIHLGAKYSPCMRKDMHVEKAIADDRSLEERTGCCIRNDGSGCVQSSEPQCSSSLSRWHNWRKYPMLGNNRTSGPVCGTDPRKCKNPLSQGAYQWSDDITKWPICTEALNVSENDINFRHLTCKLAGRPCCIGIQGECIITTREDCQFQKGFFHEEAFLCSQVSCMNEICGMIRFLNLDVPDQFYRLWTSLFLHAGLLQLLVSILFQFFIMRDMEKLSGWHRICIIYIGSGIAGSLSSAIFLPYHVEAGPAGSQFGVLAMVFAEVIQNFYIIAHPWRAIGKLSAILIFLFVLGLLPYIDNYAHLIGFVFGFLLAFALLPYITFNKLDKRGKIIGIVVCLLVSIGLFAVLIVLFYVTPVYDCPYCHYFNCIPFTPKFCESMKVEIGRDRQKNV